MSLPAEETPGPGQGKAPPPQAANPSPGGMNADETAAVKLKARKALLSKRPTTGAEAPASAPTAHADGAGQDEKIPGDEDDLSPQQAAQEAATDLRPWQPFRRLRRFIEGNKPENVIFWRSLADISLPGPDLANFPNSSYTLPKGGAYLETSPVGFYGSSDISVSQWNWEYLLRYGVTDNIEARIFSNGLSNQSGATGFSPLAFDAKAHLWAGDWDYFNVSIGAEAYVQTTSWLASPAFVSPLQYSFNLLFDHELPWDISFEWNLGFVRQTNPYRVVYLPTVQWAFQRDVTDDVAVFIQGYHNADALPRIPGAKYPVPRNPNLEGVGFGGQWTPNKRVAFFGSYNWGLTKFTPSYNANVGFALSF